MTNNVYNVAIIIITFNPTINVLRKELEELKYFKICIVDNASKNILDLQSLSQNYTNVKLIINRDNLGIAAAQNMAIRSLKLMTMVEYILFLDQDSFISKNSVNALVNDCKKLEIKNYKIASISAVYNNTNLNSNFEFVNEVISSGSLIPIKNFEKFGLLKDDFFIDMVDYEWSWRLLNNGYLVVKDYNCKFDHQIGSKLQILGKTPIAPFRLYYVYRNTIYLLKQSYLPKGYHFKLIYGLGKQLVFNTVFCPERLKRFKYISKGIYDGIRNKLGKLIK